MRWSGLAIAILALGWPLAGCRSNPPATQPAALAPLREPIEVRDLADPRRGDPSGFLKTWALTRPRSPR